MPGAWRVRREHRHRTLHETYIFDDGHSDPLRWTIHKMAGGQYISHENRLDGEAVGEQAGCVFHLVQAAGLD
ncbi:DUF3833 family protein [Bradyrhizobium sp. 5.13L]